MATGDWAEFGFRYLELLFGLFRVAPISACPSVSFLLGLWIEVAQSSLPCLMSVAVMSIKTDSCLPTDSHHVLFSTFCLNISFTLPRQSRRSRLVL